MALLIFVVARWVMHLTINHLCSCRKSIMDVYYYWNIIIFVVTLLSNYLDFVSTVPYFLVKIHVLLFEYVLNMLIYLASNFALEKSCSLIVGWVQNYVFTNCHLVIRLSFIVWMISFFIFHKQHQILFTFFYLSSYKLWISFHLEMYVGV